MRASKSVSELMTHPVQDLSLRLCFLKRLSDRQKHFIHVLEVANNYYRT